MLIPSNLNAEAQEAGESMRIDYSTAEAREILLNTLVGHRLRGESESFCKIAISSLLKKLWAKRDELENLMIAITTAGLKPTECVTIPRSLDGRLQVSGKKFFPHVVYAKIWRWPDVLKNEMTRTKNCGFAFDLKRDWVCVNPYHYKRCDPETLKSLFPNIPSLRLQCETDTVSPEAAITDEETFGSTSGCGSSVTSSGSSDSPSYIDVADTLKQIFSPDKSPQPAQTYPYQDVDVLDRNWRSLQPENTSSISTGDGNSWDCIPSNVTECYENFGPMENYQQTLIPVDHNFTTTDLQTSNTIFHDRLKTTDLQTIEPTFHDQVTTSALGTSDSKFHDLGLEFLISENLTDTSPIDSNTADVMRLMEKPTMDNLYGGISDSPLLIESIIQNDLKARLEPSQTSALDQISLSDIATTTAAQFNDIGITSQWTEPNIPSHIENLENNVFINSAYQIESNPIDDKFKCLLTKLPLPDHWCSVDYFELHNHVGETFKVRKDCTTVTIDGYVDPTETHRFCLGALTNVQRTEASEKVRLHIGKGVTLELREDGDVWLACRSENSVFLQSHYLDTASGLPPGSYVHKIHPSVCVKVFDLRQCYTKMKEQAETEQKAATSQAAAVKGHRTGNSSVEKNVNASVGIGVDDLRQFCILSLSFVKGWGRDYPRPSIKDAPCWVEVHLHRALQLLDDILHTTPIHAPRFIE